MNIRLLLQLSLEGLAIAIAAVYWIPSNLEADFWVVLFIISAFMIAKECSGIGHGFREHAAFKHIRLN